MQFSIGYRLFLAVLLAFAVVGAAGVQLVRWRLFDAPAAHAAQPEALDGLVAALSARYGTCREWACLPHDAAPRARWLRDAVMRADGAASASPTLALRVALLDANGRFLAGAMAGRATIAFASIDTVRRPLVVDGRTVGYVLVASPRDPGDALAVAFLIDQQRNLAVIGLVGLLSAALAAALLASHFRRPIRRLVAGARRLEQAQFDTRIDVRRSDELGELATSFDHLAAKLEDAETARRLWVADTSHDLRTPLAVLRAQAEALQDGVRAATPEHVAGMLRQVRALEALVDALHLLARADVGQLAVAKVPVDAWALAVDVMDDFADRFRAASIVATVGAPPRASIVACDAALIRQVVANLLENSVRHTAAGGRCTLDGAMDDATLRIAIDDSAPGVPDDALPRLGERFFRADASRTRATGGSGIGLALCRKILALHDGRLEFAQSPLGGLRATIVLPRDA